VKKKVVTVCPGNKQGDFMRQRNKLTMGKEKKNGTLQRLHMFKVEGLNLMKDLCLPTIPLMVLERREVKGKCPWDRKYLLSFRREMRKDSYCKPKPGTRMLQDSLPKGRRQEDLQKITGR
jgi:hypothetical protein